MPAGGTTNPRSSSGPPSPLRSPAACRCEYTPIRTTTAGRRGTSRSSREILRVLLCSYPPTRTELLRSAQTSHPQQCFARHANPNFDGPVPLHRDRQPARRSRISTFLSSFPSPAKDQIPLQTSLLWLIPYCSTLWTPSELLSCSSSWDHPLVAYLRHVH
jgi:hypothetical protein